VKVSDLNRWHLAFAAFMLPLHVFLCCEGCMRVCSLGLDVSGRYCSAEQTLSWLSNGSGWGFWLLASAPFLLYVALYAVLVIGFIRSTTD
jgi:hypothetical protein